MNVQPDVSIILLTLNEAGVVGETLDQVFAQEYLGAIEVIHIDSDSDDDTCAIVKTRGVETIAIARGDFHHSRTRNMGADRASHDILIFLSADAVPRSKHWLAKLTAPFADPKVGGVYGKQVAPPGTGALRTYALACVYPDTREVRDLAKVDRPTLAMTRFSNANCAVRTELCRRFRFHEDSIVCEDHGMCWDILQAGYQVVYEPEAAVTHGHERPILSEFGWAVDNAVSLRRMGILGNPAIGGELRYGIARIVKEFRHFAGKGQFLLALGSFVVSVLRWLGIQVGKREDKLPRWLIRRLSPGMK